MVLGADTHKRSHTIAAVAAETGEVAGEKTVAVGARGFGALLIWARGLGSQPVWALEDCRQVAGSLGRSSRRACRRAMSPISAANVSPSSQPTPGIMRNSAAR